MFYISKITPAFFLLAFLNLSISLIYKSLIGIDDTFLVSVVFGFIGMVIAGALYQIVPNSQNRELMYPVISYIVFSEALLSFLFLYSGYFKLASLLLFVSILTMCSHLFINIRNWTPPTVKFLGMAMLYFSLSSFLLFLYSVGLANIQVSVHTFTLGVMLNAIYGVEVAWIPMLTMTVIGINKVKKMFYAKQVSTFLLILSFFILEYGYIALFSLFEIMIAIYFVYMMYSLVKGRRVKTALPPVVKIFLIAMVALIPGVLMGFTMAIFPLHINHGIYTHINLLIYGFGAFTIFGGIMHLLPRIVWNWKYSNSNLQNKPMINELIEEGEIPKFIKVSTLLYVIYTLIDVPFIPLQKFSFILYFMILIMFAKITFLPIVKRIWRDRYVGSEAP